MADESKSSAKAEAPVRARVAPGKTVHHGTPKDIPKDASREERDEIKLLPVETNIYAAGEELLLSAADYRRLLERGHVVAA